MEQEAGINRCERNAIGLQPPGCEDAEYPQESILGAH
jgi:hypothetical protein